MFFFAIDVAMHNSYKAFKCKFSKEKMDKNDFMIILAVELSRKRRMERNETDLKNKSSKSFVSDVERGFIEGDSQSIKKLSKTTKCGENSCRKRRVCVKCQYCDSTWICRDCTIEMCPSCKQNIIESKTCNFITMQNVRTEYDVDNDENNKIL